MTPAKGGDPMLILHDPSPDVPTDDAERLEHQWGVTTALDMLLDHEITALEFIELCEESADAPEVAVAPGPA